MGKVLEQTEGLQKKETRGGARKNGGRKHQGARKKFSFKVYEKDFWKMEKIKAEAKEAKLPIMQFIFSKC